MDIALSLNRPAGAGAPSASGFPTTFYIDFVRVWQRV
jgi:hypothetical protein